jgi:hypothetical protein
MKILQTSHRAKNEKKNENEKRRTYFLLIYLVQHMSQIMSIQKIAGVIEGNDKFKELRVKSSIRTTPM